MKSGEAADGAPVGLFILSSSLGTYLEFLDYTLFAYASKIIAIKLLPPSDHALTYTWMIFAAGFLFRILGTFFFGSLADRRGGRPALLLSMLLMTIATCGIGLIPDYGSSGWFSVALLLFMRSLQSFAVSPEYSGAASYLRNNGYLQKRFSLTSSITVAVAGFGMLSGGFFMSKMAAGFTPADLPGWRWRLPFVLCGVLVGFSGLLLRLYMKEEKKETEDKPSSEEPLKTILRWKKSDALRTIGVVGLAAIMTYTLSGYFANFLHQERGFELGEALSMASSNTMLLSVAILFSGYLADRFSSLTILRAGAILILLCSLPLFYLVNTGSPLLIRVGLTVFSILLGFFSGPVPGFLAKSFVKNHRYTGSSIGYNLGMSLFGGITPLSMLHASRFSPYAPGLAISSYALLVLLILRKSPEEAATS